MAMTSLGTPPRRTDLPETFIANADVLLGQLPAFVTEANALQTDVGAKQVTASAAAVSATASSASASGFSVTAAASAAAAAMAAPAYSGAAVYVYPNIVAYTDGHTYRCIDTTTAGESPASTPSKWLMLSAGNKLGNVVGAWQPDSAGYNRLYFGFGGAVSVQGYGSGIVLQVLNGASEVVSKVLTDGSVYSGIEAYASTGLPQLGQIQRGGHLVSTAGGSVDAITASFTPQITVAQITDGTRIRTKSLGANTISPTLTVGSWVTKETCKGPNLSLLPGDIPSAGYWCDWIYSVGYNKWVLQNPMTTLYIAGGSPGALAYQSSTSVTAFSDVGAAGQVLTSTAGGAPVWANREEGVKYRNLRIDAVANQFVGLIADSLTLTGYSVPYPLTLSGLSLTGDITTSGRGGRATGVAHVASTMYSIWVGRDGSGSYMLFGTSNATPPTPSGTTHLVRVGWCRTDATGNKFLHSMIQKGNLVEWQPWSTIPLTAYPTIQAGVIGTVGSAVIGNYQSIAIDSWVPSTAAAVTYLAAVSGNQSMAIAPTSAHAGYGALPSVAPPPLMVVGGGGLNTSSVTPVRMLYQGTLIHVASDGANNRVMVMGWEDNL